MVQYINVVHYSGVINAFIDLRGHVYPLTARILLHGVKLDVTRR